MATRPERSAALKSTNYPITFIAVAALFGFFVSLREPAGRVV
jgi:hypothetical protein